MSYIKWWNSTSYWLVRLLSFEPRGTYYPGWTVVPSLFPLFRFWWQWSWFYFQGFSSLQTCAIPPPPPKQGKMISGIKGKEGGKAIHYEPKFSIPHFCSSWKSGINPARAEHNIPWVIWIFLLDSLRELLFEQLAVEAIEVGKKWTLPPLPNPRPLPSGKAWWPSSGTSSVKRPLSILLKLFLLLLNLAHFRIPINDGSTFFSRATNTL